MGVDLSSDPGVVACFVAAVSLVIGLPASASPPNAVFPSPVTVGNQGEEPGVTVAPDGTIYVNANGDATLYRSDNGGATWKALAPHSSLGVLTNSDSSVAVDSVGTVYMTFFNNYADSTAVCSSTDRGETWGCNANAIPGVTDRMWVFAQSPTDLYLVTNEGTSSTVLATSANGNTWVVRSSAAAGTEGDSGPIVKKSGAGDILQPAVGSGSQAGIRIWQLSASVPLTTFVPVGLTWSVGDGIPNAGVDASGAVYVAGEQPNASSGVSIGFARSTDDARHWTVLPVVPGTESGTATFPWVAAGRNGHVGILYYYTALSGDPNTIIANWSAMWAESFNANAANPDWTVVEVEHDVRTGGGICSNLNCDSGAGAGNRFASDFIGAAFDAAENAHLVWQISSPNEIHYNKLITQPDTIPNSFSFASQTAVPVSSQITSNSATISGINAATPITVSGGEYSVNGAAFTTAAGTVNNNQAVQLRHISASAQNTPTTTTVTIGGVSATFTSTTADTTPDPFSFSDQSGVAAGATVTSGSIVVSGINAAAAISVSGGQYSLNGGAFTAMAGSVTNGQTVQVRHTAASTPNTATQSKLTIGGVAGTFTSTTAPGGSADTIPDDFSFADVTGVATDVEVKSGLVTITGINAAAPVSITGGEYSVAGGAFTASSGSIGNGQSLQLRHMSASVASTQTQTTVSVGGVARTFTSTTAGATGAAPVAGGGGGAMSLYGLLGVGLAALWGRKRRC